MVHEKLEKIVNEKTRVNLFVIPKKHFELIFDGDEKKSIQITINNHLFDLSQSKRDVDDDGNIQFCVNLLESNSCIFLVEVTETFFDSEAEHFDYSMDIFVSMKRIHLRLLDIFVDRIKQCNHYRPATYYQPEADDVIDNIGADFKRLERLNDYVLSRRPRRCADRVKRVRQVYHRIYNKIFKSIIKIDDLIFLTIATTQLRSREICFH